MSASRASRLQCPTAASSLCRRHLPSIHSRRYINLGNIHKSTPDSPSPAEIAPLLEEFAKHSPRPLTLPKLFSFGRPLSSESLLESASYVLSEVPRLFGSRVKNLEALPFIVGMNPFIARTLAAHRKSFKAMAMFPPVRSLEENSQVTAQLESLVQAHANDIPTMAKGFQECSRYMTPEEISEFLDSAICNRIAVRLIAEQHIALSRALQNGGEKSKEYIGVIHLACSPKDMIKMCGSFVSELCEATFGAAPEIIIDGDIDATFVYVPVHLEYILTEILKNAFRASVERHQKLGRSSQQPIAPVYITISPPSPPRTSDPLHNRRPSYLSMRIRDEGGGVSESNISQIFSYSFTTAGWSSSSSSMDDGGSLGSGGGGGPYAAQHVGGMAGVLDGSFGSSGASGLFGEIVSRGVQVGMGTIAGLGYGLPMSRLYAKYFGGSLDFVSLDGWGSDVFLKLRCLDDADDVVIW
ncbi:branched-chain alpha-ketoacid dehydrogenase [Cristinia sonorae]|uniref:Protein-serine/threonine kinase n=1 Tax=Cristinia sonorae TaxID=1940300 RepID=A0A8K0UZ93_9AGAR|nr:branched-chain alpha-ketoacid dehydrogenase [Cristinia sonorae]